MKMETQCSKIYGTQKKQFQEGVGFIVIQISNRKQENFQINDLSLHLKELGKEEQTKSKLVEGNVIKIRAEIK